MEKNEKIQMLLDMQEHPENYSEQELKTMLKDPEVRELMEATALLKQAMIWERLQVGERSSGMNARKNAVNVDAEWQRFAGQHEGCRRIPRCFVCVGYHLCGYPHSSDGQ